MNKKVSKKLSLSKETVVNLNNTEMDNIKGGYITATCPDWCNTNYNCTTGCPSILWLYCNPSRDPECETNGGYC